MAPAELTAGAVGAVRPRRLPRDRRGRGRLAGRPSRPAALQDDDGSRARHSPGRRGASPHLHPLPAVPEPRLRSARGASRTARLRLALPCSPHQPRRDDHDASRAGRPAAGDSLGAELTPRATPTTLAVIVAPRAGGRRRAALPEPSRESPGQEARMRVGLWRWLVVALAAGLAGACAPAAAPPAASPAAGVSSTAAPAAAAPARPG